MTVNGNVQPAETLIETHPQDSTKVIVFLRENVEQKEVEIEGQTITIFEYDEYQVITKRYQGIEQDVQNNKEYWFLTGQTLEGKEKV